MNTCRYVDMYMCVYGCVHLCTCVVLMHAGVKGVHGYVERSVYNIYIIYLYLNREKCL